MTDRIADAPPQMLARIGGVLYLIIIVAGIYVEIFIKGKLIVPGDATATAIISRAPNCCSESVLLSS